jgi:hypothetical protein
VTPFTQDTCSFESVINKDTVNNIMEQQKNKQLITLLLVWFIFTLAAVAGLQAGAEPRQHTRFPASAQVSYNLVSGHQ